MPCKTRFSKKAVAWMKGQSLGFMDDAILHSDLALLGVLDEQIGYVEEKLASLAVDDARVRLLMTMTGVDYFAAMLVLAEMVTDDRFSSDKSFSAWMGLAPRVRQSGEKTWVGGVGGPGNRRMRWLMVQCAHSACRHDPRLRRLFERHSRRKDGKSTVAAVAHEMARIMYFMLKRNEPYRGVNRGLWERKPGEYGEESVKRLAELTRIPPGHLSPSTVSHRSLSVPVTAWRSLKLQTVL